MNPNGRPRKFGTHAPMLRDEDGAVIDNPLDEIDESPEVPVELALKAGAEIMIRLMNDCMPGGTYRKRMGHAKHWMAAHHRMVAVCYLVAPEMFNGLKPKEVAAQVGLSWWAFRKQLRTVQTMLDARQARTRASTVAPSFTSDDCKKTRVLPGLPTP